MKRINGFQFILGLIAGAVIFGGGVAYAAGIMAQPKTTTVVIDGKVTDIEGYIIEGRHYFQLRDLDAALIPGDKDFSVVWDETGNRVIIDTARGYDPNEQYAPQSSATQSLTPDTIIPTRNPGTPAGVCDKDLTIWQDENYTLHENELEAIRLINEERANAGLEPVTINIELCKIARIKAVEMVELGYFSHESPNYGAHADMVRVFGLECEYAGENAAYLGGAYASGVVWNWMHSEGHKENILNPKHKEIGIGVCPDGTGLSYWSLFLMY